MDKIAVLIPCYNESKTIEKVVTDWKKEIPEAVNYVYDKNSSDGTAEIAKKVVKACYEGGVRAFEFTNRGDFAHEVFAEIVKFAAKECPEMAMGIGSIVDPATVYSVRSKLRSRSVV